MKTYLIIAIVLLTAPSLGWGLPPSGEDNIGVIRNSTGIANITRGEKVLQAAAGTKLHAGDTLTTGSDGSLGIILRDNSLLSLGPDSQFVLKNFSFTPAEGKIGLLARISKGSMAYVSGLIGKISPQSVRFETPVASIGIRGTYFAVKVEEPGP
ncbi:MAG: FecR domain-containing protein [Deltaproteobacteria bacterium]